MRNEQFPSNRDRPGEKLFSLTEADADFVMSALHAARMQADKKVQDSINGQGEELDTQTLEQLRNLANSFGERAEVLSVHFGIDPYDSVENAMNRAKDRI